MQLAQDLLLFPLLGVDSDNESKYITRDVMSFAEKQSHLYKI